MTKSELILAISAKMPHLPAADVEVVVNTMFDSMAGALEGVSGPFSVMCCMYCSAPSPKKPHTQAWQLRVVAPAFAIANRKKSWFETLRMPSVAV